MEQLSEDLNKISKELEIKKPEDEILEAGSEASEADIEKETDEVIAEIKDQVDELKELDEVLDGAKLDGGDEEEVKRLVDRIVEGISLICGIALPLTSYYLSLKNETVPFNVKQVFNIVTSGVGFMMIQYGADVFKKSSDSW